MGGREGQGEEWDEFGEEGVLREMGWGGVVCLGCMFWFSCGMMMV